MTHNFLVSYVHLLNGNFWVLLTSTFSHNLFWHLFLNMYVFFGFGGILESYLGPTRFIKFYLTAGIVGSLIHCIVSAFILGRPEVSALGASGAIAGVILYFSLSFPKEKILLFGLIPIPAIWGAVLLVGLDLWGLVAQSKGGGLPIGHGAHLGGSLVGVIYYFWSRPKNSNFRQWIR